MQSPKKIAVAGATGRVGHHVVDVLRARGYDVVPMSRSQGVDVITGDGLAAALAGVGCVIDTATGPSPEQEPATAFFTTAARNLQDAGQEAEEKAAPATRKERPEDVKHTSAQQEKAEGERGRHGGQDRVGHGHRAHNAQGDAEEHKPEPVFP